MSTSVPSLTELATGVVEAPEAPPALAVVRGEPDALELAALVAGIAATADAAAESAPDPGAEWANRSRYLQGGRIHPTSWRWSAHP